MKRETTLLWTVMLLYMIGMIACQDSSSSPRKSDPVAGQATGSPSSNPSQPLPSGSQSAQSPAPSYNPAVPNACPALDPKVHCFTGSASDIGSAVGRDLGRQAVNLIDEWLIPMIQTIPFGFSERYAREKTGEIMSNKAIPASLKDEIAALHNTVGGDGSLENIYLANNISDVTEMMAHILGCSTYVIMPERSTSGGMLYGRNLDYFKSDILRTNWTLVVFHRAGTKKILSIAVPGMSGILSGINESGVMVSVMASMDNEDYTTSGVPMLMMVRLVLEQAESTEHAIQLFAQYPRVSPFNVMIADGTKAAIVEMGISTEIPRYPTNGVLYGANHFVNAPLASDDHKADDRWPILQQNDKTTNKLSMDDLKKVVGQAADFAEISFLVSLVDQNILAFVVDFKSGTISYGSDEPVAIRGRLTTINFRDILARAP